MLRPLSRVLLILVLLAAGIPRRGTAAPTLLPGRGAPLGGPLDPGPSRGPLQQPVAPAEEEEEEHRSSADVIRDQSHVSRRIKRCAPARPGGRHSIHIARPAALRRTQPPLPCFQPRLQI